MKEQEIDIQQMDDTEDLFILEENLLQPRSEIYVVILQQTSSISKRHSQNSMNIWHCLLQTSNPKSYRLWMKPTMLHLHAYVNLPMREEGHPTTHFSKNVKSP